MCTRELFDVSAEIRVKHGNDVCGQILKMFYVKTNDAYRNLRLCKVKATS
jgi:hypothetical protein